MTSSITKSELLQYASTKPYLMVVVYADWCGHCKRMKDRLGSKMQDYQNLLFLESKQVDRSLVSKYPTVFIFENGQMREGSVDDLYHLLRV